jgi:hypothetical protein
MAAQRQGRKYSATLIILSCISLTFSAFASATPPNLAGQLAGGLTWEILPSSLNVSASSLASAAQQQLYNWAAWAASQSQNALMLQTLANVTISSLRQSAAQLAPDRRTSAFLHPEPIPQDFALCGNGICDALEDCTTCPRDCTRAVGGLPCRRVGIEVWAALSYQSLE